jgi:hypothetical protein
VTGKESTMRTIEIKLFEYDELTPEAKAHARAAWVGLGEIWDSSDWWNSAQEWAKIAPVNIDAANYDHRIVDVSWDGDEDVRDLTGLRAWKWLQNNGWFEWARREALGACTRTGFCGDAPFADPLVEYEKRPLLVPDLKQVFYECAQAWLKEASNDADYAYSTEGIEETFEANGYEFLEDGTRH